MPRWHRPVVLKRGGLLGTVHEALCGEAPKGQPVIRRERLVAVGGDDPKGHPMIHGCRRPHSARPSGNPKGRRAQRGTPSSLWIKAVRKNVGKTLPNFCMESGVLLGEEGGFKGDTNVFLEKDDEKKEVSVEKLIGEDGPRFWFKDRKPDPPEQQPGKRLEDQSVVEDAADETTTENAPWL